MRIPTSEIKISPGRQKADPIHVSELSKSIVDVGLLNLITVDSSYTLIAGLHRLKAAKQLGWAEIECTVCDIDSIRAELAEIDENVIRRNLTNTEVSGLLARRKKLYETLHLEPPRPCEQPPEFERQCVARTQSEIFCGGYC